VKSYIPLRHAALLVTIALGWSSAFAASMNTDVYYIDDNSLPSLGGNSIVTDTTVLDLSGMHGAASGQSNFGRLAGSGATSVWTSLNGYTTSSSAQIIDTVRDTVTFNGGSGQGLATLIFSLSGAPDAATTSTNGATFASVNEQFNLNLLASANFTPVSAYGSYSVWANSCGGVNGSGCTYDATTHSFSIPIQFTYGQTYDLFQQLTVTLHDGAALNSQSSLSIVLPTGTTISTESGANYVSVAVPEPESYAMLLGGLGVLGIAARRRKTA
jgi:hypothetical protein